jgi:hypothetical protein
MRLQAMSKAGVKESWEYGDSVRAEFISIGCKPENLLQRRSCCSSNSHAFF